MRTPGVKRQTLPKSGFFPIFSAVLQAKRRPSLATCSVFISVGWCTNVTAPNTYGGSTAIGIAVTESVSMVLCALETYLYPHTVLLGPQVAQGQKLAVET
jgi:hypothetical protein